ncbi:MAG: low affinity iron permease family protein [Terracidiphilus sp.]|jgi:low affinity Fe/Cu permease
MNRKVKIQVSAQNRRGKEQELKIPFDHFGRFAGVASFWLGSKWAFLLAGLVILVWVVTGPFFHYSDTWQLVINTGTTIVTFLMVFLIQNTQNRDARAINLKLDELIRAIDSARNQMINIETLSDMELDLLHAQYEKLTATRRAPYHTGHANASSPVTD